jgi:hypothetical protein
MAESLLVAHACVTWALVGLIWTIQAVHYPLFAIVGAGHFATYEAAHTERITLLVGPAMATEALLALLLCRHSTSSAAALVGLLLLGVAWLSTALLQVPCHEELSKAFDAEVTRQRPSPIGRK